MSPLPNGTIATVNGEEVVIFCRDQEETHYKVEAIDGRRFWVSEKRITHVRLPNEAAR